MEISRKLKEAGLTKEILAFVHSRTANSKKNILKAECCDFLGNYRPGEPLKARISFEGGGLAEYTIDIAKARQKRLNLLLAKGE